MKDKTTEQEEVGQKPKVSNLLIRTGSIVKISASLAKAWGELESAKENADNPYFKSKYAPLKEVIRVAKAVLPKHGLCVLQPTTVVDGQKYVMTLLLHSSGQYIGGLYPITPGKPDPQGVGSAVTYARRYALASMLGISSDEDDDAEAAVGRVNPSMEKLAEIFQGVEAEVNEFLVNKNEISDGETWRQVRPKLASEMLRRPSDFLSKATGQAEESKGN